MFSQCFGIHDWEWPLLTPAAMDAYCRAADKLLEAQAS